MATDINSHSQGACISYFIATEFLQLPVLAAKVNTPSIQVFNKNLTG